MHTNETIKVAARLDEWLTASKSLVNLEANSAINKATSLATAINQLAVGGSSASQMSGDGTTLPATTITSFWVALGEKAQMSTDRITTVKNAERTYYGSTQWYPANRLANIGLRRVGNAGWNLLPMPRAMNGYLGRHAWQSFGVGAVVGGGTVMSIGSTGYYAFVVAGESVGLAKDVIIIILQD